MHTYVHTSQTYTYIIKEESADFVEGGDKTAKKKLEVRFNNPISEDERLDLPVKIARDSSDADHVQHILFLNRF